MSVIPCQRSNRLREQIVEFAERSTVTAGL